VGTGEGRPINRELLGMFVMGLSGRMEKGRLLLMLFCGLVGFKSK
jgi:hypothetical protein